MPLVIAKARPPGGAPEKCFYDRQVARQIPPLLEKISPHGEQFKASTTEILSRENNWILWKRSRHTHACRHTASLCCVCACCYQSSAAHQSSASHPVRSGLRTAALALVWWHLTRADVAPMWTQHSARRRLRRVPNSSALLRPQPRLRRHRWECNHRWDALRRIQGFLSFCCRLLRCMSFGFFFVCERNVGCWCARHY